jgi:hypothetical protein
MRVCMKIKKKIKLLRTYLIIYKYMCHVYCNVKTGAWYLMVHIDIILCNTHHVIIITFYSIILQPVAQYIWYKNI